jgi:nitrite reductase/ring-hydroxylating ferredoxin subunit
MTTETTMAQDETKPTGPDLSQGIPLDQLPDGKILVGHVGGEDVLLVRRGQDIFAIVAHCTQYRGPLAEGLVVGDTVRCPRHHACFQLRPEPPSIRS